MTVIFAWLWAHKLYIVSGATIASAWISYWAGAITYQQAAAASLAALGLSANRHDGDMKIAAIKKGTPNAQ